MTPQEWAKITDLFGEAIELPPLQRASFLADVQRNNAALAAELESLVRAHERPGEFLPDAWPPPRPAEPADPQFGPYRLIRPLGAGGMGTVYLAERTDGAYAKQVAIKLLSPALAHSHQRFQRERELLARLEHPNIARLIDGGTSPEGWPYLVMEYVDGAPIDRYCSAHQLSIGARLGLLLQVCAGVAHAHQRLVIHCDIKPENILVTPDGTVKLLDFGIAKLLDLAGNITQFRPATPSYSSPEQLTGEPLTTATDVYALGVLGYVLFTGQRPYANNAVHVLEAVEAVLKIDPAPASRVPGLAPSIRRRLSGDLENILARALAKDPGRRYTSAQQLADDLELFRDGFPVRARADTAWYRVRRFVGRHRVASLAALTSVTALVAALLFSIEQARVADRRFTDLRALARTVVFDVDDQLRTIPGTTAARKLVVDTALQYLDRLSQERQASGDLAEELAAAYLRVGKVQGGAFLPNLGDTAGAIRSFGKALATLEGLTGSNVDRLRMEAHINIALLAADPVMGAPSFARAIAAGERQLAAFPDDVQTLRLMAQAWHGQATIAHVTNQVPEHERAVTEALALRERLQRLAPPNSQDAADLARAYAQHALALAQKGDPASALPRLHDARAALEAALRRDASNQLLIRGLAELQSRTSAVLVDLQRLEEAVAELDRAMALLAPLVASDKANRQYHADLAYAWMRMGEARRAQGRLSEALDWHQRALAVRRDRAKADGTFMFVPWELARSLNTVGELLLDLSSQNGPSAAPLFDEARELAVRTLELAPSFNEVRKQLAIACEGLARVALARAVPDADGAKLLLEESLVTWREVFARSVGDHRDINRMEAVQQRLAAFK